MAEKGFRESEKLRGTLGEIIESLKRFLRSLANNSL